MSLKDAIYKMSHNLVETSESSDDLRLKKTAFTKKRRLDEKKQLKYSRRASQNRTIAKLRERFWHIFLEPGDAMRARLLERLCLDIASRPQSIRPGRSPLHKAPRNKRFPIARKSVLP